METEPTPPLKPGSPLRKAALPVTIFVVLLLVAAGLAYRQTAQMPISEQQQYAGEAAASSTGNPEKRAVEESVAQLHSAKSSSASASDEHSLAQNSPPAISSHSSLDDIVREQQKISERIARDFAVIARTQSERRSIVNDRIVSDYRDTNQNAYNRLYELYTTELAALHDINSRIPQLRHAYGAIANRLDSSAGRDDIDTYRADTGKYLATLSQGTLYATAADEDLRLVLQDLVSWRPLYVGSDRIAQNIYMNEQANTEFAKAHDLEFTIRAEQHKLLNGTTSAERRRASPIPGSIL